MSLTRAILRHPVDGERIWLAFSDPVECWEADQIGDVRRVLDAAEEANRRGLWVVGMVSYDAAPAFDDALRSLRADDVPLAAFAAFEEATPASLPIGGDFEVGRWQATRLRRGYEADIRRVKELIAAGETYQVNYTMRLEAEFSGDPLGFFAAMARAQRSADHLAYLDLGDRAACSASPELFIRRTGRTVESRPMKGTRPRHPDPAEDERLAAELTSSEKDRAENTMIVDMVRNDLGRIGDIGSLRTRDLHTVESYSTVHQLTSTVEVDTDAGLFELFAATFPGASITGAPKVNTAGFIADLERTPRGLYTGAIGALAPGGDLEFNIAIRTAWIHRAFGRATYGVGGGVVWDSDPTAEWNEAHDKARVLYRADRPFRLLETIAWDPGTGAVLLQRHLDRLAVAATHFGFDLDLDDVRRRLDEIDGDEPTNLRVLVGTDGTVEIERRAMPTVADDRRVVFDVRPIDRGDEFLRHKTTRRQRYDDARARVPDAYDVLLWNRLGELSESTVANLVIERDGDYLTPPDDAGLLPGTLRAELLDAGRIREHTITLDDLRSAERVWLINSVRGWVEVDVDFTTVPGRLTAATTYRTD
ncbi:MAG: bifunctional anthranilate synthase component I family protein/class IV aminotransferase [Actinomycetota bacterium]